MKIILTGSRVVLTDAMQQYLEKKLTGLEKFFDKIVEAKAILGLETHHHHKGDIFFAECKLRVPGKDLFAKKTAKDIYTAIDQIKDELEAELKKYKQKVRGNVKKNQSELRKNKEYRSETDE